MVMMLVIIFVVIGLGLRIVSLRVQKIVVLMMNVVLLMMVNLISLWWCCVQGWIILGRCVMVVLVKDIISECMDEYKIDVK